MLLPKYLTTVTKFSKLCALVLFTALPFIGFYSGYNYAKNMYHQEILGLRIENEILNAIVKQEIDL